MNIYVYVHIYIEREREKEGEKERKKGKKRERCLFIISIFRRQTICNRNPSWTVH